MSVWFKRYRNALSPRLRLFCFPYAGGNAAVFDGWQRELPQDVDVFAVQAPGRSNRFAETPIASLAQKVAALHNVITPYLDVPSVFIGHSNGALTAFELARSLQRAGQGEIRHLILSAKRAPHLPRNSPVLHDLPDGELIEELRTLAATPRAILDDPEIIEIFLPMLRADFALAELGAIEAGQRLRTHCTLFYGAHDQMSQDDMWAWDRYIDGPLSLREFDGGHFFIDSHRAEVIAAVREILQQVSGVARPYGDLAAARRQADLC